jgi:Tfp pilus assembly protein PilF
MDFTKIRNRFPDGFPQAEPAPEGSWRNALVAAAALAVSLIVLFWPAVDCRRLSFDDYYYTQNDVVSGGLQVRNIVKIFTTMPEEELLIPVTQLSYMADVSLFGNASRGFHLTNVVLHALGMGILLLVFWRMTGSLARSALMAALVGVHPLRVESVAWITERKDVLSFAFMGVALGCYTGFVRTGRARWYAALLLFYALGLLSKAMLVTVPFLLLLLDYWPLGRFRGVWEGGGKPLDRARLGRLLLEKLPLLLMALAVSAATLYLQREEGLHPGVGLVDRLEHAFSAVFIYLRQTVWPANLMFTYFKTPWEQYSGTLIPASLGMLLLLAAVAWTAGTRPWVAAGLCWYLVALFPVSGVVPTGLQWISDRFTYIPHVGLAFAFVWGAADFAGRRARPVLAVLALLLVPLAILSRHQLGFWRDGATLFGKGIAYGSGDPRYVNQYVEELLHVGDLDGAEKQLARMEGTMLDPMFGPPLQIGAINVLERRGDRKGAIAKAEEFLRKDPRFHKTRMRLADNLLAEERYAEAAQEYRRVNEVPYLTLRVRRFLLDQLGFALFSTGRYEEAWACYENAARGNPWGTTTRYRQGLLLSVVGNRDEAMAHYRASAAMAPQDMRPRIGIADLLMDSGNVLAAVREFEAVAGRVPGRAEAFYAKARIAEASGATAQVRAAYEAALAAPADGPEIRGIIRRRLGAAAGG